MYYETVSYFGNVLMFFTVLATAVRNTIRLQKVRIFSDKIGYSDIRQTNYLNDQVLSDYPIGALS